MNKMLISLNWSVYKFLNLSQGLLCIDEWIEDLVRNEGKKIKNWTKERAFGISVLNNYNTFSLHLFVSSGQRR